MIMGHVIISQGAIVRENWEQTAKTCPVISYNYILAFKYLRMNFF